MKPVAKFYWVEERRHYFQRVAHALAFLRAHGWSPAIGSCGAYWQSWQRADGLWARLQRLDMDGYGYVRVEVWS